MPSDHLDLVRYGFARGVATITLNSPHNRNALSTALMAQLADALTAAANDDGVRVIVLTHTGSVFCSGADLAETAAALSAGAVPVGRLGEVLRLIWEHPKPVIARVGGAARAGGLGLIAAADIAVCADPVSFAFSEVRLGVIPAVISATILPRLARRAAAELYLTGDTFDGPRAAAIGLVTVSVPPDDLDGAVQRFVASVIRGAPAALTAAKGLLRRPPAVTFSDELADLSALSVGFFTSPEGREGVAAFREKRDPNWVPIA